jgi:GT2 family glycosyltransferase
MRIEGARTSISPPISIVIPTYNRREKLLRLLESIQNCDYPRELLQVVVVDDSSSDGTADAVQSRFPDVDYLFHETEELVAKSLNDGLNVAKHEMVLICDDDNVIDSKLPRNLVKEMLRDSRIAVAGPVTYYFNRPDYIQYAGARLEFVTRLNLFLFSGRKDLGQLRGKLIEVDGVANCFLVRKSLLLRAGGFPYPRIPWAGEDGYVQYKLKKMGYKVVVVGNAKVYHDWDARKFFSRPNLIYYSMRSRIFFHRDLESTPRFTLFLLFLPFLLAYYAFVSARSSNKKESLLALVDGVEDGLRNREEFRLLNSIDCTRNPTNIGHRSPGKPRA